MAIREDVWLSEVLGYPVYVADAEAEPPGNGRSLTYAKVAVEDVDAVRRLTERSFAVVDVNVTLTRDAALPAPAGGPFAVEAARPEHHDALLDIAGRCFRYSRFHLDRQIPEELANRVKREWVRSYVEARRGVELLAALDGDGPVGFLAVLEAGGARVIDLVGVAPEHQGRGAGRALVSAFIARHGPACRELRVGTQIANVASLRLYEGLGFAVSSAAYVLHLHRGS